MSGRPWMHVDPRQLPTDLKEPAMDAGYPPDRSDIDYHAYVERELNKSIDETARLRQNYLDDFTRAVIDLDGGPRRQLRPRRALYPQESRATACGGQQR